MTQQADVIHPGEPSQIARDWWHQDQNRPLPGEETRNTVFVIDFYDGCKYFGYTKDFVIHRTASLSSSWSSRPPRTYSPVPAAPSRPPAAGSCTTTRPRTQPHSWSPYGNEPF